jgi:hypothetical protein
VLFKFEPEFSFFLNVAIGRKPIQKDFILLGWDKYVHVEGEYLKKTA